MGHSDETWYVGGGGHKYYPPGLQLSPKMTKNVNLQSTSWHSPKGGPRCIFFEYNERVSRKPPNSSLFVYLFRI